MKTVPPHALLLGLPPPPARASWVGPGRLQNPRRPSWSPPPPPFVPQAVPLLLPPRILQTARPRPGQGGTPLRGTPGSEPSAKPPPPEPAKEQARNRPRPQNLSLAAAATAGRRGRRSGRRDELVGRRGKKFLDFSAATASRRRGDGLGLRCPTEAEPRNSRPPCSPSWTFARYTAFLRRPYPGPALESRKPRLPRRLHPKTGAHPLHAALPPACLLSPPHPRTLSPPGG